MFEKHPPIGPVPSRSLTVTTKKKSSSVSMLMSSMAASREREELNSNMLPLVSRRMTTCLLPVTVLTYLGRGEEGGKRDEGREGGREEVRREGRKEGGRG